MKTSASLVAADLNANPHPVEIIRGPEEKEIENGLQRRIAERAYEIFQSEGATCGRDLGHWFKAEKEILNRVTGIRESGAWVIINFHVPNVPSEGFRLFVGENRALIAIEDPFIAHRQAEWRNSKTASYYLAEWPGVADPKTASAYIKNGTLTLEVKLIAPHVPEPKQAAAKNQGVSAAAGGKTK
jgi:hypothetical protein